MTRGSSSSEGRHSRFRFVIVTGLVAATTMIALAGSAAIEPEQADAWAWRDTCIANVTNNASTESGAVRPVEYIAIPPSPTSYAVFFALAVNGIPFRSMVPLSNTGWPAPAYGCHGTVSTTSPIGLVNCAFSAPTTGRNSFSCNDNAVVEIFKDDDDIGANVWVNRKNALLLSHRKRTGPPPMGPPAIRPGNLPGKGWVSRKKFGGAGLVSRLMRNGSLPDSCSGGANGSSDFTPEVVSSTLLGNRRNPQTVGAVIGTYASHRKARSTTLDALSDESIGCLRRLLRSDRFRAKTARPIRGGALDGVRQSRLVIVDPQPDGGARKVGHMMVVGATSGRRSAVVMLSSGLRQPLSPRVTRAAVRSVLKRIGG